MVDAQTEVNTLNKNTATEIEEDGDGKGLGAVVGTKWSGSLIVKGFKLITKIKIEHSDITELIVEDCPLLTEIDISDNDNIKKLNLEKTKIVGGQAVKNDITEVKVSGDNKGLEELNLKNCGNLGKLVVNDLGKIKRVEGVKDFNNPIKEINMDGSSGLHLTTTNELERLEDVEKVINEILGGSSNLPMKTDGTGNQVIDTDKLKVRLKDNLEPSLKSERDQAQKEAKEAKEKLQTAKQQAKTDLLKELANKFKLSLSDGDITKDKVFSEIEKKINPPCPHTDYDTIKSQKDSLQTELNSKKRKITELENDNKENEGVKKVKFGDLGIKLSSEQQNKIKNASSSDLERVSNEILKTEFTKLQKENDSSFYLNVGLGTLAIGSLILLGWIIMRQNGLPKKEK